MKRFLRSRLLDFTMILLLVGMTVANAEAFETCQSGAWFDPAFDGQGLYVEVNEPLDKVVAYFYGYGNGSQDWHLYLGDIPDDGGPAVLSAFEGKLVTREPFQTNVQAVGSGMIEELEDGKLLFSFHHNLDMDHANPGVSFPWCLGQHCAGEFTLSRLTIPFSCGD